MNSGPIEALTADWMLLITTLTFGFILVILLLTKSLKANILFVMKRAEYSKEDVLKRVTNE